MRSFKLITLAFALSVVLCVSVSAGTIYGTLVNPLGHWQGQTYTSCNIIGSNPNPVGTCYIQGTSMLGEFIAEDLLPGTFSVGMGENANWAAKYLHGLEVTTDNTVTFAEQYEPTSYVRGNDWFIPWGNVYCQSFKAKGDALVSIGLAVAGTNENNVVVTILDGDSPLAPQVGPSRTLNADGNSLFNGRAAYWSAGEVPTVPGQVYTVKFTLPQGGTFSPLRQTVKERMAQENPEGHTWIDGVQVDTPIEMTVNQDDDGLTASMCAARISEMSYTAELNGGFVGQTFTANGSSVLMVTWQGGANGYNYQFTPYDFLVGISIHDGISPEGVPGAQVGPTKYCQSVWFTGRSVVSFAPGEVPTVAGNVYFVKLTPVQRSHQVFLAHPDYDYPGGTGYVVDDEGVLLDPGADFAMAVYEDSGNTGRQVLQIDDFAVDSITANSAVVTWTTAVPSTGAVEYGEVTPYAYSIPVAEDTSHSVTLTDLQPNTMYHVRAIGNAPGMRIGGARDVVFVTAPDSANLIGDPGFEESVFGTWVKYRTEADVQIRSGSWIYGVMPRTGMYGLMAARLGDERPASGGAYQQVAAVPNNEYKLSAWVWTYTDGGIGNKDRGHQITARIGIDPTGGIDPASPDIVWSSYLNSHEAWTKIGVAALAQSDTITVFLNCDTALCPAWSCGFDDVALTTNQAPLDLTLGEALRDYVDGYTIAVDDVICTATEFEVGAYYLESADRASAIRVESTDYVYPGDRVHVSGVLSTLPSGERYLTSATMSVLASDEYLEPLAIRASALGGTSLSSRCVGVPGSFGPYNVGLLARIVGTVSEVSPDWTYFRLNDGSVPGGGIKVLTNGLFIVPMEGDVVCATGIVMLEGSAGSASPCISMRAFEDLVIY